NVDAISPENKVLIALAFFATGSYQTITGQCRVHGVSQPTVSRAIKEVVGVLNVPDIINKYIVFPLTQAGREQLKTQFYSKFNIPGVVGCIDGTHVSIIKPTANERKFVNRKGYHSLNVQIICDVNLNIMSVDASHPGSTHDSVIWGQHPLNNYIQRQLALGENFLGDSGYALRPSMMTPILNALPDTPEEHYYNLHDTARNTVERCIGVLKARFRCLLSARQLHYDTISAARIVNACCVLHNIANKARLNVHPLNNDEIAAELAANVEVRRLEARTDSNRNQNQELLEGRAVQQSLVNRLCKEKQRR
ncbi:LOW QUALITY PROTEIN: putative nuclease HARBI1, partial [Plodia interpunctella]|uniref:LOW QUALITY PROTEIN: putative nuclease HARBI1 n=1 Tax=Plodia interpunctella TaxID=58824 RepID=UPI002367CEB2